MATVLERAKTCRPAQVPHAIRRSRLLDALHRASQFRLTVVTAPAGYGKTTLLRQFIDELPSPAAWVTLDGSDRDPAVLLADMRTALDLADTARGSEVFDWRESALTLCRQLDRIGDTVVLVLDDLHEVDDEPEIDSLLRFLLDGVPDQVRFILSSRTRPRLSAVPLLTAQRRTTHLSEQAIRLTHDEVRLLFQNLRGQELSPAQARRLCEACEGWVAGLLLIAGESDLEERPSGKPEIAEYFRKVAIGPLSDEMRDFLLATSVLAAISAPICNRLLRRTNSQVLLEELHRRNLFIERLESEPAVYRYHRLFRDFLYEELEREDPTALRHLHGRAGRTYLSQHDRVTAARHFIASGDYGRAASALATTSGKQLAEASLTVAELLDSIPEETFRRHPRALLIWARLHYSRGDMDRAVDTAARAFLRMQQSGDVLGMAETEVVRAMALKHRGEVGLALDACRKALTLTQGHEDSPSVRAEALLQMGICRGLQGRLLEATKALKRARSIWIGIGELEREGVTSEALGTAFMELGDAQQAHLYYERAREVWARLGYDLASTRLLLNSASLYLRQGEYDAACDVLESVVARLGASPDPRLEAIAWINLAELKRDVQLYDEALHCYTVGQEKARGCLDTWASVYAAEGRATVMRLRGEVGSGESVLRDILPQAEKLGNLANGLVLISLAATNVQGGAYDVAREQIQTAIGVLRNGRESVELARAHFWSARLAYKTGCVDEVRSELIKAASYLGPNYILPLADLRSSQRLLRHAVAWEIEPELFSRLLHKARTKYSHLAGRGGAAVTKRPRAATVPTLAIRALGEASVEVNGRRIADSAWRSEKAKELFFFLAWEGRGMRRLTIESALWPDFSDARAHTNFRVSVFRARQATFPDAIGFSGGRYGLNRNIRVSFDARDFVELVNLARRSPSGSPERLTSLQKACGLYRGGFLEGVYSDWSVSVRNDLETQSLSALIEVADQLVAQEQYQEARVWYERAIRTDALMEAAYEGVIRACAAANDFPAARHYYRSYRSVVQAELGQEPPDYLRRLVSG